MCFPVVAAPTTPSASGITHNTTTFTWQSLNAGDKDAMYEITCSPDCSHDDTPNKQVTITGLKAATVYTLNVVAIINDVRSSPSSDGTATTSELININV